MSNKRSKLIVNRKLQLSDAVAAASLVILCINFVLIAGTLLNGASYIQIGLSAIGYVSIGVLEGALLFGIVYWSLKRSHRYAGPLYAIARDLQRFADGDLSVQVKLRPDDEFQDEARMINAALEAIRSRIENSKDQATTPRVSAEDEERRRIANAIKVEVERLKAELNKDSSDG